MAPIMQFRKSHEVKKRAKMKMVILITFEGWR